jgi:hypothetical protein
VGLEQQLDGGSSTVGGSGFLSLRLTPARLESTLKEVDMVQLQQPPRCREQHLCERDVFGKSKPWNEAHPFQPLRLQSNEFEDRFLEITSNLSNIPVDHKQSFKKKKGKRPIHHKQLAGLLVYLKSYRVCVD